MKAKHDIYISDETKENKYVIKGNTLTCRWIEHGILIYPEGDEPDFAKLLGRMENERNRMATLLIKKGIKKW